MLSVLSSAAPSARLSQIFSAPRCKKLLALAAALIISGCAHRVDSEEQQLQRIAHLQQELLQLNPAADPQAAQRFAETAVLRALELRQEYGVRLTPWMHNVEVNSGTRPRGLCYHWADDLRDSVKPLATPYWSVYKIKAKPKTPREHNALSITKIGDDWQNGIVLDGWRHAGVLYVGPVKGDKYPWQRPSKNQ